MNLLFDPADIKPLIHECVAETLQFAGGDDRLAFDEAEAARLLSVPRHVLRDCRLRGEVQARRVGKSFRYSRAALVKFMDAKD